MTEDAHFSSRYSDLESEVNDLAHMARLAEIHVGRAIGQLQCRDGKYIEAPDYEDTGLAIFAVSQLENMVKRFRQLYYSAFEDDPSKPLAR